MNHPKKLEKKATGIVLVLEDISPLMSESFSVKKKQKTDLGQTPRQKQNGIQRCPMYWRAQKQTKAQIPQIHVTTKTG